LRGIGAALVRVLNFNNDDSQTATASSATPGDITTFTVGQIDGTPSF
jgi:hypothetical protein